MIGKVLRGRNVSRLIWYLYGPGRREEHTDPHIVAGWREPGELEPPVRDSGSRDFRRLAALLRQPHAALGERGFAEPVWHCPVRAAPGDKMLSDAEWAEIAADIIHATGLAPRGQEDSAVRWIAVRHGEDHIHIVAMLARQDGTRPRFWGDYYRVGEACRAAEIRHGLRRTAPRDGTAARRPSRAEAEKARRNSRDEPPRLTLRRAVCTAAAGSSGEDEFFARLASAGIEVRRRYSQLNPGQVTGYAVALLGDVARDGTLIWFGGGKLAADLTLPALRRRWGDPAVRGHAGRLTAAERSTVWQQAADAAERANQHIRSMAGSDPAAAQDAAWAAADTLHAAAAALRSRVIREAATAYDRASRAPYRRLPARSRSGSGLRRAARLLSATGLVTGDPGLAQLALIPRLAALAESVAVLRDAEGRAAQAAAARAAAERLRAPAVTRPPRDPRHLRTTAGLAGSAFTSRPQLGMRPDQRPQQSAASRRVPSPGPSPQRRRRGG